MRVVIYGTRPDGHAKTCLRAIELSEDWECVGCLDDVPENRDRRLDGLPVLGGRERLSGLAAEGVEGVVLGFGSSRGRLELAEEVRFAGLALPKLVHPDAVVAPSADVGDGVFVARGAVASDDVTIGEVAAVHGGAYLSHDSVVGAGANIGPAVVFAGRARVGVAADIGANATLLPDANVGEGAVVGAGAVVLRSVEPGMTVAGNPARPLHESRG